MYPVVCFKKDKMTKNIGVSNIIQQKRKSIKKKVHHTYAELKILENMWNLANQLYFKKENKI